MRRDALRVRRYLDGVLVDERELTAGNVDRDAASDARWATYQWQQGRKPLVVIDDPAGDVDSVVFLDGEQIVVVNEPEPVRDRTVDPRSFGER